MICTDYTRYCVLIWSEAISSMSMRSDLATFWELMSLVLIRVSTGYRTSSLETSAPIRMGGGSRGHLTQSGYCRNSTARHCPRRSGTAPVDRDSGQRKAVREAFPPPSGSGRNRGGSGGERISPPDFSRIVITSELIQSP